VEILAAVRGLVEAVAVLAQEGEAEPGFQINLFWIIAQAVSFLLFLTIIYLVAFRRIGGVLNERRDRIEQGLRDADAARQERERAADEKLALLTHARQEANEIVTRAQKVADETRQRELDATRQELERVRTQAAAEIEAEKERALSEVRGQIAELALSAAGKVVGETMNQPRERRLVDEFLSDVGQRGEARS
jgi:F-type H+-transporting ATPase subunit b